MKGFICAVLLAAPTLALCEEAAKPAAEAPKAGVTVLAMKVGTGLQDRELQGEAASFKPEGKVYCWTKTSGGEGSELSYVWYQGDKKASEVKVKIKVASMRAWTNKTITAESKGDWRVDLVGPDGAVLKSVSFKVE